MMLTDYSILQAVHGVNMSHIRPMQIMLTVLQEMNTMQAD